MSELHNVDIQDYGPKQPNSKAEDIVSAQHACSEKQDTDESDNQDIYRANFPRLEASGSNVLNRIASRVTTRSLPDPGPPPDGGTRAWIQCAMAWIVVFNTWGYVNSFGIQSL